MPPKQTDEIAEPFTQYVDRMHDKGRSVAVFVEGDLAHDPPLGNAAATRIAHLLTDDSETVLRMEPGNVTDETMQQPDEIGAIQTRLLPTSDREEWAPLQQRLLSRVPRETDVVALVDSTEVPWFCKDLCDVRVVADEIDAPMAFYRVKLDHYTGDVYYHEMDGLHGDSDGD